MKGARGPALVVGLMAALTLAGCGVPPSDVIQAGAPASGMFSPAPSVPAAVALYFVHDGDLTAYPRAVRDPGDFGSVVGLLFDGPTSGEAVAATTELPRLDTSPEVTVGGDNTVSVRLPDDASPLSHLAMLQLACTVTGLSYGQVPAHARQGGATAAPVSRAQVSPTSVHVVGSGWTMTQSDSSCPARPRA